MQTFHRTIIWALIALLLGACSGPGAVATGHSTRDGAAAPADNRDLSCAYFYFLWGSHAEFGDRLPDALDAYEKALVCDPSADYIKQKLPLLFMKMGDTDRARQLLEETIEQQPRDTARRALLASIYIQRQERQRAIDQYRAIIDYEPDNGQILLRLGALLSQIGEYDQARSILGKLLDIDQEAYLARLYLARVAVRLDEIEEAKKHYLAALALNWSADLVYEIADFYQNNKRYDEAIDILRTALADNEADEQARLGIVQALLALNREEEAIAELGLARQYSSSPERISVVISRLYLRLGEQEQAVNNLRAVLDEMESSEARYLLAVIYAERERFDESLTLLDGIEADDEEFDEAIFLKTKILHESDRTGEALQMLENFLNRRPPGKPMFYLLAASLYRDLDRGEDSLKLLATAAELFPDDEQVLFEYGLQLERNDRLDEAIGVMEKIIAVNPDHAEALNFVGYSWADTNRHLEQALVYIKRALALKPGNGYIQDSLGWVHYRLGNLERAEEELLGALQLLPEDPHIHDHLGDLYDTLGQIDKARSFYETALEKFGDEAKEDEVRRKLEALDSR